MNNKLTKASAALAFSVVSSMAMAASGTVPQNGSGNISFTGNIVNNTCQVTVTNANHTLAVSSRDVGLGTLNKEIAQIVSPVSLTACPNSTISLSVNSISGIVGTNAEMGGFAEPRPTVNHLGMNLTTLNPLGLELTNAQDVPLTETSKLKMDASELYYINTATTNSSFDFKLSVFSRGQNTYLAAGNFIGGYTYTFTYI